METTEKTQVHFIMLAFNKDEPEVLALFPEIKGDLQGNCSSYLHCGQHGAANYLHCIQNSRNATPDEYAELHKELESIGYNLEVLK